MRGEGVPPDMSCFRAAMQVLVAALELDAAFELLRRVQALAFSQESQYVIHHTLLSACRRAGDPRAARLQSDMLAMGLSAPSASVVASIALDGEEELPAGTHADAAKGPNQNKGEAGEIRNPKKRGDIKEGTAGEAGEEHADGWNLLDDDAARHAAEGEAQDGEIQPMTNKAGSARLKKRHDHSDVTLLTDDAPAGDHKENLGDKGAIPTAAPAKSKKKHKPAEE